MTQNLGICIKYTLNWIMICIYILNSIMICIIRDDNNFLIAKELPVVWELNKKFCQY